MTRDEAIQLGRLAETDRPWDIGEVLARSDLAALLDDVAVPAMPGRRWHCPVPAHDDVHASVGVHRGRDGHERWRCWSGDDSHRGDAIDLVMVTSGLGRRDAVDWLARRAGMVPGLRPPGPVRRAAPPPPASPVPLDPLVARYHAVCERVLWSRTPVAARVQAWLAARGLDEPVLRANRVGCDPGAEFMKRRKGLPYVHGGPAAVFPAWNSDGRELTYVQARLLDSTGGDKYQNPAGSRGSNPRLGWCQSPGPVCPGAVVVCEGLPDALIAAQAGFRSAAMLGSQTPDLRMAARLAAVAGDVDARRVLVVIDANDAGRRAGDTLVELLHGMEVATAIIEPPEEGLDLTTWAQRDQSWPAIVAGHIDRDQQQREPAAVDVVEL